MTDTSAAFTASALVNTLAISGSSFTTLEPLLTLAKYFPRTEVKMVNKRGRPAWEFVSHRRAAKVYRRGDELHHFKWGYRTERHSANFFRRFQPGSRASASRRASILKCRSADYPQFSVPPRRLPSPVHRRRDEVRAICDR